jgi:prepilin-type processing-associated H-X9-DG protein
MKVVDWLVAVGLVVGAAAVIYPLFTRGGPGGHPRTCIVGVKCQSLGILMYKSDNDERYPLRESWMDSIDPYLKNEYYFHCPALQELHPSSHLYGYCFHGKLSGAKTPASPDKVELIFDSAKLRQNASGSLDSLPKLGRHGGRNYIAYADGHVKAVESP